ncbi:ZN143 protein, partial [Vidua chalybeata]|nr:ZN143 protein [Vidua chalybeata]
MLLAQINRDSQGMTEFSGGGMEAQHVTLCLTEAVAVQGDPSDGDNLENMEGVSLQAVTLADGSTAYIQHNSKDGKLMDGQVIQLEDGSAAYVQHVPMPKNTGESLRLEDGQAVQLEDGTTAFIHHTSKDSYDQSALQAVQLEDGTTAYIHHTVQMPQSDTILAIQADGTVAGLHTGDAAIDPITISALEQYAAKVSIDGNDSVSSTGIIGENEQDKKMQIVLQGHGTRVTAKSQQTGEKAFRCDYDGCGKLYTTAHHLKVHERSHTGDRPYQCEHPGCGKAFATGYGLKSHVRTHTGEKPYRCTEENCTKSFKTSGDLQKHIRTHTG